MFGFGGWTGKASKQGTPEQRPDHKEGASQESACRRVFQTELGGARGLVPGERRDVVLKTVEPPSFPTWVSYVESITALDRGF